MLFLALVAAGTAVAAHMGGSAPLAALLGGMLLKQLNPRPWAWPRQLGNASSLLTMLMFVLVSTVAARLKPGVGMPEVLDACFPPASVTGTPKLRARELRALKRSMRDRWCARRG